MRFTLSVDMDNAAFEDGREEELAAILGVLAKTMRNRYVAENDAGPVRDVNGNTVGSWEVTS